MSSEWSRCGDGRIDFRIVDPSWGIEFLRDGDRLSEHCNKFVENGLYHQWISNGLIKDWLILDCRHSHPHKYGKVSIIILVFENCRLTIITIHSRKQALASCFYA